MPDWRGIADTITKGMFQDDWNKTKMDEERIKGEQQRQLLAGNADTRAAAEEGRRASDQKFQESQRPMLQQKLEQEIASGRISNANAQKLLDDFDRRVEAEKAAAARAEKQVGFEGQRVGQESQRIKLAQEAAELAKRAGEEQLGFDKEARPARLAALENAGDPRQKYSSDLNSLSSLYNAAVRNGDKETVETLKPWIVRIQAQQESENAAWNQRRNSRISPGGSAPPQGAAGAFKNAAREPWLKDAVPEVIRPNR